MKNICRQVFMVTKRIGQILLSIIPIVLLVFLFLFVVAFEGIDISLRYWLYYGDLVLFNLSIIFDEAINQNQLDKNVKLFVVQGILTIEVISLLLFIPKYHWPDFDVFWAIFSFALYLFTSFAIVMTYIKKEQKAKIDRTFIESIAFYVFSDFLFISFFKFDFGYTIVFGIITFVMIFTTILKYFISGKKLDVFFIIDCIIALIVLAVTIWKLPVENNLQNIVLQLSAALIGGILTMLGVVLTIKSTDNNRKEELKNQLKPLVFINNVDNFKGLIIPSKEFYIEIRQGANHESCESISFREFVIQNSDASYPIVQGLIINHKYFYRFKNPTVLNKGQSLKVIIRDNIPFESKDIKTISLCTSDVDIKSFYLLDLIFERNDDLYCISGFDGSNKEILITKCEKSDYDEVKGFGDCERN